MARIIKAICLSFLVSTVTQASATTDGDFREPRADITAMLTATPPPEPLLHTRSGHIALRYREAVIPLARVAQPRLGLAGFRFDPLTGTSNPGALITQVELLDTNRPGHRQVWQPGGDAGLDYLQFSPDGQLLAGVLIGNGPAQLALFDIKHGKQRLIDADINAAWGDPCRWIDGEALLCLMHRRQRGAAPAARPMPIMVEHDGGPAPIRTYQNLLENTVEDAQFDYHFSGELARIDRDGKVRYVPALSGQIAAFTPSADGAYAMVTRLQRPYSRLVPARQFPSTVEVWDLRNGRQLYASKAEGFGIEPAADQTEEPRRGLWKPGATATLGYLQVLPGSQGANAQRIYRWLELSAPFTDSPREVCRSAFPIRQFGWTSAGTPWFTTEHGEGSEVRVNAVFNDGVRASDVRANDVREVWRGNSADRYGNPGKAIRSNGDSGAVLEIDGHIFLAGEGLSSGGPRPFLDRLELRSGKTERLFEAQHGVYETVLGLLDPAASSLITSRETTTEPPNLLLRRGAEQIALRPYPSPYPALNGVERRVLNYRRGDGVALSATLYLPANHKAGTPLPTLIWIYPYEYSDREQAEQLDVRNFRFHRVKGPSPLAAAIAGYAVLVNPTVPILHETGSMNDDYLPQLVASAEAAVDYLVAQGISDPARIAVGGRSYGAFSSANLLVHSKRFATAITMSGAYNRTLTPFGFQHEKRSFWQAKDLYTSISPFFFADRIKAPILIVHGGSDENPGTPPLQARRFFHALVGQGAKTRYIELPQEGHHYWARENVLLATAEMLDWLDQTIGVQATPATP